MPVKSEDGVTCVQQGQVSGPLLNKAGKLINCFHCGENHHLSNCPQINDAKKKEIMAAKKKHWDDRNLKENLEKAKKTTPGQAHMQMSVNEVEDEESIHQDDEDDDLNFAFIQNG